jgi:hypothetical protein
MKCSLSRRGRSLSYTLRYGDDVGDPDRVTNDKFLDLLSNFDSSLKDCEEIVFYYNPGRFHPLYKRLLDRTVLKDRIRMITHYREIA